MSLPDHPPAPIAAVLAWRPAPPIARLALASPFLIGGIVRLADWNGAVAEMAAQGLGAPAVVAAATVTVQLAGAALFLWRRTVWLGAGILAAFCAIATLITYAFWTAAGVEAGRHMATFFEHIAIIGGLATAAILADRPVRRKL